MSLSSKDVKTRSPILPRLTFLGLVLCLGVALAGAAPVKLKTTVDKAAIKSAPEIRAKSLVKLPLGTALEAKGKRGEWFEVEFNKEGQKVAGFIHEMLVEEVPEAPAVQPSPTASATLADEVAAEIAAGLDSVRDRIRQNSGLDEAEDVLDGLLAKAFRLDEPGKRRSLAVEIYLWKGLGRIGQGKDAAGLLDFRRMFDVDPGAAKEATRNIATPKVVALLETAERQSLGQVVEYKLDVSTEPAGARVVVDGKDLGPTPGTFRLPAPMFVLEVRKPGYAPIREDIFLASASGQKSYVLEPVKREMDLSSTPAGAMVTLDGKPTGLVTNCRLPGLAFGRHTLGLSKPLYLDWSGEFEVGDQEGLELKVDLIGRGYVSAGLWGGDEIGKVPAALAGDSRGFFYVFDESPARLKKLTPEGQVVPGWSAKAPELREIKIPSAMAVDGAGTIYIADDKRNIVLKVSPDGGTAVAWNGRGGGTSEFRGPSGLACDASGNIYVAEALNNRVKKYSAAGEFIRAWGAEAGEGQLQSPRALAVSAAGDVYVLDKSRVLRFSADGAFRGAMGGPGRTEGLFQDPQGLAVDGPGCAYVADAGSHLVQKFGPDGRFICAWGGRGREEGKLWGPAGVRTDAQGRVLVLEKGNGRVQAFVVGGREESR